MPIYDKRSKTVYTDGGFDMLDYPYVTTHQKGVRFIYPKKRMWEPIYSYPALLRCYSSVGIVVKPMSELCTILGTTIEEVGSRTFKLDGEEYYCYAEGKSCNFAQLVEALGISDRTWWGRCAKRKSLSEAEIVAGLLLDLKNKKSFTDHLGNEFPSLAAMARRYDIHPETLRIRLARGWALEEALQKRKEK